MITAIKSESLKMTGHPVQKSYSRFHFSRNLATHKGRTFYTVPYIIEKFYVMIKMDSRTHNFLVDLAPLPKALLRRLRFDLDKWAYNSLPSVRQEYFYI